MASPTQWTWVWVDSGSWWWTGRPGVLQFMGSRRVRHNWATELNWSEALGNGNFRRSPGGSNLQPDLRQLPWSLDAQCLLADLCYPDSPLSLPCLPKSRITQQFPPITTTILCFPRFLCPWDSSGKNTRVGCHFLLQGIFPNQESNPGLLHCRQILYQLSYKGIPKNSQSKLKAEWKQSDQLTKYPSTTWISDKLNPKSRGPVEVGRLFVFQLAGKILF